MKFENKKNATPRINLKSPVSEHRNSFKKEQKVCLLICPELTIFISYICEVDDENKIINCGKMIPYMMEK